MADDPSARRRTATGAGMPHHVSPSATSVREQDVQGAQEAKESRMWLFIISKRGYFAEARMRPILEEANAIVRILGKGVSTARRGIAEADGGARTDDGGQ